MRRLVTATAIVLALVAGSSAAGTAAPRSAPAMARPTVIATLEDGVNVLHRDFRFAPGQPNVLPAGLPTSKRLRLPESGTFAEQVDQARAAGFGAVEPGVLHWVEGTRLLLFVPPGEQPHDVFADPRHGTGVASAAVGLRHGTDPTAFLVVVLVDQPRADAWEWLTQARWVDIVSTSYNNLYAQPVPVVSCPEGAAISRIVASGRLVVSAVGNGEQLGQLMSPSGHPAAYQVGGVDEAGRTWRPNPTGYHRTFPNRPYETGDRFEFPAAAPDSLDGEALFGGTSGATPTTAGRASALLRHARSRATRRPMPASGPLRDGVLGLAELVDLLHRSATPAEAALPGRYLVEGYGALGAESTARAIRVLDGHEALPDRAAEDEWHVRVEAARAVLFPAARCP